MIPLKKRTEGHAITDLTRFCQEMMTRLGVPCFAFWSAQSITTIKLTFCCNWTHLLLMMFQTTKLAEIDPAWGTEPAALKVKYVGIQFVLLDLVFIMSPDGQELKLVLCFWLTRGLLLLSRGVGVEQESVNFLLSYVM